MPDVCHPARAHQDPRRQAILEQTRWVRSERTNINPLLPPKAGEL